MGREGSEFERIGVPGSVLRLKLDAESGSDLGDPLVVPSHPVALAKLDSRVSSLVLIYRALDDLLLLVAVVLALTSRINLQVPERLGACVAQGVVDPSWLDDEQADRGDHDLAADVQRQLAL